MATIHILDCPGFQNPATCGRIMGAGLEDLCHNYTQERLQSLFHDSTFLTQQERYLQVEGIAAFEFIYFFKLGWYFFFFFKKM